MLAGWCNFEKHLRGCRSALRLMMSESSRTRLRITNRNAAAPTGKTRNMKLGGKAVAGSFCNDVLLTVSGDIFLWMGTKPVGVMTASINSRDIKEFRRLCRELGFPIRGLGSGKWETLQSERAGNTMIGECTMSSLLMTRLEAGSGRNWSLTRCNTFKRTACVPGMIRSTDPRQTDAQDECLEEE